MKPIVIAAMLLLAATAAPAHAFTNPCSDPAGAARDLKAANPNMDNLTLYYALVQGQELYGCRQPTTPAPMPDFTPAEERRWITTPQGIKQCVFLRGQLAGCY